MIRGEVSDAMVEAALKAEYGMAPLSLLDVGDPYYKELRRDIVRAALQAAFDVAQEECR